VRDATDLEHELARLPEWSTLKGIDAAVARLADGILRNEAMLIVADYDADGATACAVGVRGLRAMGAKVDFLVPNRFEFGYGLTPEICRARGHETSGFDHYGRPTASPASKA